MSRDERADINAALRGEGFRPPKRVTSWRVCPACGDRATKLFRLSSDDKPYECQGCHHRYNPPMPRCPRAHKLEMAKPHV